MSRQLTLATRKSALALAQMRAWVRLLVQRSGVEVEELLITTTGDQIQDKALSLVGGKGLFIKEIEEALLDGRAQLAVHSLKDVPAEVAPGLVLGCISEREDARDALCTRSGKSFAELPPGSRVGTSSLRRVVQLRAARPDLEYVPIRGNVDTRLKRCEEGVVDAVVLAYAGLKRLGLAARAVQIIESELVLPAIGQGALAVECRADDSDTLGLLRQLEHSETAIAVYAERGVMKAVEGNCQIPVAGYACRSGAELWLRAMLSAPDGSDLRRVETRTPWPTSPETAYAIGLKLGAQLKLPA